MARKYPAAFMRGGTSKALVFHARDLPTDLAARDAIFIAAIGSPDHYGRQLNGMGGGVSSLSKVCLVGSPSRDDADVDYTFGQVQIKEARVDYRSNCGNMSSAIGPFAVDQGLVNSRDGMATVRIHNTNTGKLIHSTFSVRSGRVIEEGSLEIPGVAGTGAPIRLDFLHPGGSGTGKLLPSGNVADVLHVPGVGQIEVSMVDAANACVFINAADVGLLGTELPDQLELDANLLTLLASIRQQASVAMGIAPDFGAAAAPAIPFIGFVSPAQDSPTLSGDGVAAAETDVTVRMLSNGQPHRALPATAALCVAVAAGIEGTVVQRAARRGRTSDTLRIGMPSGILQVGASVRRDGPTWHAQHGTFYRTARRLFEGFVYV